jgi:hypothetical protein
VRSSPEKRRGNAGVMVMEPVRAGRELDPSTLPDPAEAPTTPRAGVEGALGGKSTPVFEIASVLPKKLLILARERYVDFIDAIFDKDAKVFVIVKRNYGVLRVRRPLVARRMGFRWYTSYPRFSTDIALRGGVRGHLVRNPNELLWKELEGTSFEDIKDSFMRLKIVMYRWGYYRLGEVSATKLEGDASYTIDVVGLLPFKRYNDREYKLAPYMKLEEAERILAITNDQRLLEAGEKLGCVADTCVVLLPLTALRLGRRKPTYWTTHGGAWIEDMG